MRTDTDDAVLVEAIITLAHKFNMTVVAEGVEDMATLQQLCTLGCDFAQGYYFSKPLPQSQFSQWLADYEPAHYWPEN